MQRSACMGWIPLVFSAGVSVIAGCAAEKKVDPVLIPNRNLGSMAIAVAPALNLSGSSSFDGARFADLMASELGQADGVTVIPVSRVLAVLAAQGAQTVESKAHALEVVSLLGADAILVFSVTEYDPYMPPSIAISAQLYGTRSIRGGVLDPVALSKSASFVSAPASASHDRLLAEAQRVFDASHNAVVDEIRTFARSRRGGRSPYGWRRYVVSQQEFIRFCCYAIIRELLAGGGQAEPVENIRTG